MKTLYFIAALMFLFAGAGAQCVINPNAEPGPGISPSADAMPCVVRSVAFDQTIQVQCPTAFDSTINIIFFSYPAQVAVDSMELDSVIGLPSGITWSKNPNRLNGGANGCLTFSGTTNAPVGYYNLLWYGKVWAHLPPPVPANFGARTFTGVLNKISGFGYYLNVINQGDPCVPQVLAISNVNADLNATVDIYPNPSNGVFTLTVNAGSRLTGEIAIVDLTGKTVYSQHADILGLYNNTIDISKFAKGIYALQLRTTEGVASKKFSVQ